VSLSRTDEEEKLWIDRTTQRRRLLLTTRRDDGSPFIASRQGPLAPAIRLVTSTWVIGCDKNRKGGPIIVKGFIAQLVPPV